MVVGVGKTLFHRLKKTLGSPEQVFRSTRSQLMSVEGIGEKTANEILNFDLAEHVDREFRLAARLGIRILTLESSEYPELLKTIYDPPPVLYCQGEPLDRLPFCLAVVGTRLPTRYGKIVTESICEALASWGICIVSGMARGIDTLAHKTALKCGGKTVAVLGCGLSQTYPAENLALRERIVEQGAVISEFPISTAPDRNNFPARNRVISGLSCGTLVVEAGEKSGALITAQFALEQGREVLAVPGNINSPKSRGTNLLVKTGAKLVDGIESILEELPFEVREGLQSPGPGPGLPEDLTDIEKRIISLLTGEERHIDGLIENSQLSAAEVSATLIRLELKGLIRQLEGKMFIRANSKGK
ncbi:MAG: DNA-protecting protein DprA [Nitrospinae bacterium CG11_big_fil_rev_8_21_14_0_20_56_8]|nr:MAG: DNA-protecting protein DprA [Nitrospinae bacterium CG11_big_fil_rev_8_21_14_0_20_56_8]